jgi:formylglycine-generating enzyme required for sulfatase activity
MNKPVKKFPSGLNRLDASIQVANHLLTSRPNPYNMIFVEGGTFMMGCTAEQGEECFEAEKPAHLVTLDSFYMGKYLVTQEVWIAVMGENLSRLKGLRRPVENMNWNTVQLFLERLNEQTDRRFRLPTEAEWEYAARGGNLSKGYKYSGGNDLEAVGWYAWHGIGHEEETHDVGRKQANELGLYDMSGNVWEWCSDWYGNYEDCPQINPQGPSSGIHRVVRGGSHYEVDAEQCRVSNRNGRSPEYLDCNLGFRLVSDR